MGIVRPPCLLFPAVKVYNVSKKISEVSILKTAVIYARYSCDAQTEQSIEGQLHVCKEYAEKNDLLVVDEHIDRAARSAKQAHGIELTCVKSPT